jgi:hypothetical protein
LTNIQKIKIEMKKMIGILLVLFTISQFSCEKDNSSVPVLSFNQNGKFKIVQFTDIHFKYNSYRSDSALALMKNVIVRENPDLVILTGDIVCSANTRLAWLSLTRVLIDAKVPWAVTLGNHDIEYEMTGMQIMNTLTELPYNLTVNGPGNISGNGNYILKIKSANLSRTAALVYCFDSHTGIDPVTVYGNYEWINSDQVEWYRNQSSIYTGKNGGNPLPSLSFFHIPLPEFNEIYRGTSYTGITKEIVCSPIINTGLFAAMVESKDIMGIFTGHDHNNNYIFSMCNICLAYGNVTGRECYGDIGRGARIIELYEGQWKFDTWILKLYECDRDNDTWISVNDSVKKYFVKYPDSFAGNK